MRGSDKGPVLRAFVSLRVISCCVLSLLCILYIVFTLLTFLRCLVWIDPGLAMTDAQRNQKIIKAIEEATARALVSKKAAREFLMKSGIYTTKGKLRVEFGGKPSKKGQAAA